MGTGFLFICNLGEYANNSLKDLGNFEIDQSFKNKSIQKTFRKYLKYRGFISAGTSLSPLIRFHGVIPDAIDLVFPILLNSQSADRSLLQFYDGDEEVQEHWLMKS